MSGVQHSPENRRPQTFRFTSRDKCNEKKKWFRASIHALTFRWVNHIGDEQIQM